MTNLKRKNQKEGSILLISIILGSMVLGLALGMGNIIGKEINFSRDFLMSEKAYFAAESGVEKSLLDLKKSPINHVVDSTILLENAESTNNILNLLPEIKFSLSPYQIKQFRFQTDKNEDRSFESLPGNNFNLVISPNKSYQWKFTCRDQNDSTQTLQDSLSSSQPVFLNSANGAYNIENPADKKDFQSWTQQENIKKDTCFISFQNLDPSQEIEFTLSGTAGKKIAPPQAKITALGKAGGKQKFIKFYYDQNKLETAFDFVFIHKNQN